MKTNLMRIDQFVQELECKCLNEQEQVLLFVGKGEQESSLGMDNCQCWSNNCQCKGNNCQCKSNNCQCSLEPDIEINPSVFVCAG